MVFDSIAAQAGTCQPASLANEQDDGGALTARDVMKYGVISIGPKEPIYEAISLLLEKDISGLPVVQDGHLEGILSEKDVLKLLFEEEYLPGLVEDYMSTNVVTYDVEDSVSDICGCLSRHDFRRIPVLYEGRISGMITRADLIRIYKEKYHPLMPKNVLSVSCRNEIMVKDAMHYGIFSARITTSLDEAMDTMCSQQVTGLPVIDDHMYLYGIITEKDILNVIQTPNILESLVEQHMTRDVVTFSADTRLAEVCDFFINSGIHRVPIVNYDKLVGILSRADIIRKMITACKLSAQTWS